MNYPLSIAPMMDCTDRHFRFFMRQITRHTLLYTEMVTTGAILHGDREKLLGYTPLETPLILQIGGDNAHDLAECARIAEALGYNGVNLNVGCPSNRVQNGNFGACLMEKPHLVARAVAAMKQAVSIPVTVKHRIGIDNLDRYEDMAYFVQVVSKAGCRHFIVHARKAWLNGLSPKANRTVPPLRYEDVYRLKQEFPQLTIEINGGIKTYSEIQTHLQYVDAVMIGRAAYDNPYLFATIDRDIYGDVSPVPSRQEVVERMLPYIDHWADRGIKLLNISKHMLNLFAGQPGSRAWKRYLSENTYQKEANSRVFLKGLQETKQLSFRQPSTHTRS